MGGLKLTGTVPGLIAENNSKTTNRAGRVFFHGIFLFLACMHPQRDTCIVLYFLPLIKFKSGPVWNHTMYLIYKIMVLLQ